MLARNIPLYVLLAFSLLISGCTDGSGPTGPPQPNHGFTTVTIEPDAGGEVTYHNVTVIIPPGAIQSSTDITVGIPEFTPGFTFIPEFSPMSPFYRFYPENFTFELPVTVTFLYDQEDADPWDETTISIVRRSTDGGSGSLENVIVDTFSNVVTGETNQFSYYALFIVTAQSY